ncbi:phosphoribosylaminoimidazole-succinocarboxamide synthase-like protein [Truncatella angustata]|uniref:Phosphoribosylaminoimidazole-succinocarboxamide synthase n=1 Tax=Truncatella angustata TaxID=152316 RepID=A0A9P8ZUK2_9PEZI|nr:phosphoribosylaminoimidazole-succinocarboxamide synthase-like protein [Truncatella angustata]KAH6651824.1 phosphoribosylaminoimidazole-succinocarboxamide synthase-like protein [Truncatella angustata]
MASQKGLTNVNITSLKKRAEGKVRNLYDVDEKTLLFVTTDRISAYDVIMNNAVPLKGAILTHISKHWFSVLTERVPGLKTHFLTTDAPSALTPEEAAQVKDRSMQVRKLEVIQIEAIVRGYVTGSAYKEYKRNGTVHGIKLPEGLRECDAIPGGPIYTPSTKAPLGHHDENISPQQAKEYLAKEYPGGKGEQIADRIAELAVQIFKAGQEYAAERGIILADTKFEFALDNETGEIILADECLTPDSSRYWPKDKYEPGRDQESFDKQFLRNYLTENGLKAKENVSVPEEIMTATSKRYLDVFERLVGKKLQDVLKA